MSESCPKCGSLSKYTGWPEPEWACGSRLDITFQQSGVCGVIELLRSKVNKTSTALAAATKRAEEADATITRIAEAQRQHYETECIDGVWWAKGNGIVAGPQPTEQESLLEVAEGSAGIIAGCRDLIATQRTRIAEAEQERDQYKASANVGAEFFHDIGKILAPEGERKSFTDADVKQWAAEAKTAEQENARLREALADLRDCCLSLILQPGNRGYECDASEAMQRCDALLAKPEGAK